MLAELLHKLRVGRFSCAHVVYVVESAAAYVPLRTPMVAQVEGTAGSTTSVQLKIVNLSGGVRMHAKDHQLGAGCTCRVYG